MDISKYLKNKEVSISNDDLDIDKLTQDLRKGYVLESEAEKERDKLLKDKDKEYSERIAKSQTDFDALTAKYNDQANQVRSANLKVTMLENGIPSDKIEDAAKLRTTYYQDVESDAEAVQKIKEQFGKVYVEQPSFDQAPSEGQFNAKVAEAKPTIEITRNTSLKDLMKK